MIKTHRARRGATLAEVITASAILTLMAGGLVSIGVQASTGWANGTSQVMADDSASTAIQAMARDARAGIRCSVNADGTEATVTVPHTNAQGDYDRYVEGSEIRYYLSDGKLCRQADGGAASVLARSVTSIRFETLSGRLGIEITSRRQNGNRSATTKLVTQISLRNEPV